MSRASGRADSATRAVFTWTTGIALATAAVALARAAEPSPAPPTRTEAHASAVEDPQQRREGRRRGAGQDTARPAALVPVASPLERQDIVAAATEEPGAVCRMMRITGTRVKRRVCGTPEEWATTEGRHTDAAQELMRQVRDRATVVVQGPENRMGSSR